MKVPSPLAKIGLISYLLICIVSFGQFSLAQKVPVITSFSPSSGFKGSIVTLRGPNFSNIADNNIVYFGTAKAIVLNATTSRLEVVVPAGATFQPITVTVDGYTSYTSEPFILTFPNGGPLNAKSFSTPSNFATGIKSVSVSIGDLDGDTKSDISLVNAQDNNVSIYRNITASGADITPGSFAGKVDYSTGALPRNIALADLDSDGKLDIVVGNQNTNTVSLLRNTSLSGDLNAGSFAPKVDLLTGYSSIYGVAIRDLDLDGKPDIVVANYDDNTISVFRNNATPGNLTSGSFDVKIDFATGIHPSYLAIANLDGDFRPDIAVANQDGNTISLFRNTSNTTEAISFASKVDFPTGNNPTGLAIGDLDGDNKPDIVVSNLNNNSISVFRKTSASLSANSFADKVDYETDLAPNIIALSDLDGDEKLDIVVSCSSSGTVILFRNSASIGEFTASSFGAKIGLSAGVFPKGLAIGDLNGDAKPEIVVAAQDNNTFSIFQNIIPTPPVITALLPKSGVVGSLVTITGYNFSTALNDNVVKFNGIAANIVSSSELSITAIVPIGATKGPVTITVANQTGTSPYDFNICSILPVTITPSAPSICSGSPTILTASGSATYVWSPSIGLSSTTVNVVEANPSGTTTYTVTATDVNGCTNTGTVTVTVRNRPTITVTPSLQICAGSATALGASGASTYNWSPATGLSATTGNSVEANPVGTTTYTVTGTGANGCTNIGTVTVTLKSLPVITVSPSREICAGSSTALTASGANTYSWSPATGLSSTTENSVLASPGATTTYTVIGTSVNGCTNNATATITVRSRPLITVSPSLKICAGSVTTLTARGASTYNWSPATGLSSITGSSVDASPAVTTTYTVIGEDDSGCSDTTFSIITVVAVPKPTIAVINVDTTTPTLVSSSISGNQWYKDGAVITAANTPSLVIETSGTYTVQVTQDDCVSPMSDPHVVIITGIEIKSKKVFSMIFPNPASDILNIDWIGFDEGELIDVSLIDVLGRTVVEKAMSVTEHSLDISTLQQGHFLFQAKQNDRIITHRFTKN